MSYCSEIETNLAVEPKETIEKMIVMMHLMLKDEVASDGIKQHIIIEALPLLNYYLNN